MECWWPLSKALVVCRVVTKMERILVGDQVMNDFNIR